MNASHPADGIGEAGRGDVDMTDGISAGRIEAVQRDIYDALARTSERSVLPDEEQDRLLAQACAEACDVLALWLKSPEWKAQRPAGRGPIADAIPEWERVRPFLDPLKETLGAIAQRQKDLPVVQEIGDPDHYIDEVVAAAGKTARRFRQFERQKLFVEATSRVDRLRADVCVLAGELKRELESDLKSQAESAAKSAERRAVWRKRARRVLAKVPGLLLTLSLTMAGASPHTMQQNIPEWGHEAVKVLLVHHIAETAQPEVRLAPPRLGPRLR